MPSLSMLADIGAFHRGVRLRQIQTFIIYLLFDILNCNSDVTLGHLIEYLPSTYVGDSIS